ncbi:MAG: hypothetical protein Kow002_01270 [Anaerolineales bacterium]
MSVWVLSFGNADRTVKNREFWVSTGVDVIVSVAVGLAAAAVVAAVIAVAIPTAPVWGTVLATSFVGIGVGALVDAFGLPAMAKSWINGLLLGR